MRLFVAVSVNDEVRQLLAEGQRLLARQMRGADIRWQKLDQSHLTLRFLGEVNERDLPGCRLAVNEAARRSTSFTLATAGFGAFPTARRPSVLWLGVDGDTAALNRLQRLVSTGLEHLGEAGRSETFRPHLTLGRVKRLDGPSRAAFEELVAGEPLPRAEWRVDSVELMASRLHPSGASHERLLSAKLSAPTVPGGPL